MSTPQLTSKEKAFVNAYIAGQGDPKKAAAESGHTDKQGVALMKKPSVMAEIDRIEAEIAKNVQDKVEIDATWVLGQLRDVVNRCMQGKPFLDRRGEQIKNAEGHKLYEFDPSNANRALELIGKHRAIKAFEDEKTGPGSTNKMLSITIQQIIYQNCASTAKKVLPP